MGSTVLTIAAADYGIEPRGMILIEPIFLPEEFYSLKPTVERSSAGFQINKKDKPLEK